MIIEKKDRSVISFVMLGILWELWDKFVEKSQRLDHLGLNATIDKMLLKLGGRCSFRQYMLSKPDRWIKFWIFVDAKNHYCYTVTVMVKKGIRLRQT